MIANKLIAHRGWQQYYPENTLRSVQEAINVGATHIEIDLQLTADLIPILSHDAPLQRLSNSELNINEITSFDLRKLSSYEPCRLGETFAGTPFSKLSECVDLIQQYPNVTLYVELKRQSISTFGIDTVLEKILPILRPIKNQVYLISFNPDILTAAKTLGWEKISPVLLNWDQAFSDIITSLNPPLIFCDIDHINKQHTISKLPKPAVIYEIDNYLDACRLIQQGAYMIETFNIGDFIKEEQSEK